MDGKQDRNGRESEKGGGADRRGMIPRVEIRRERRVRGLKCEREGERSLIAEGGCVGGGGRVGWTTT